MSMDNILSSTGKTYDVLLYQNEIRNIIIKSLFTKGTGIYKQCTIYVQYTVRVLDLGIG